MGNMKKELMAELTKIINIEDEGTRETKLVEMAKRIGAALTMPTEGKYKKPQELILHIIEAIQAHHSEKQTEVAISANKISCCAFVISFLALLAAFVPLLMKGCCKP